MVFYRALLQSGDLAAIDALVESLAERRLNPLPVYVTSLREDVCLETLRVLFRQAPPAIILNSTAFAASVGAAGAPSRRPLPGWTRWCCNWCFPAKARSAGRAARAAFPRITSPCMWRCPKSMAGC